MSLFDEISTATTTKAQRREEWMQNKTDEIIRQIKEKMKEAAQKGERHIEFQPGFSTSDPDTYSDSYHPFANQRYYITYTEVSNGRMVEKTIDDVYRCLCSNRFTGFCPSIYYHNEYRAFYIPLEDMDEIVSRIKSYFAAEGFTRFKVAFEAHCWTTGTIFKKQHVSPVKELIVEFFW